MLSVPTSLPLVTICSGSAIEIYVLSSLLIVFANPAFLSTAEQCFPYAIAHQLTGPTFLLNTVQNIYPLGPLALPTPSRTCVDPY